MDKLSFEQQLNSGKKGGNFAERLVRLERKLDYIVALLETSAEREERVSSARANWLAAHHRRKTEAVG